MLFYGNVELLEGFWGREAEQHPERSQQQLEDEGGFI